MIKELFVCDIESIVKLQQDFIDGWSENSFKSTLTSGLVRVFGYFEKGVLVGFISLGISDIIDIETVLVKKEFRNKGVAFSLIERAITLAKEVNANSVMLEVRASNTPAISLYKKANFKQISVRKKYYDNGEDALIFQREIEQ